MSPQEETSLFDKTNKLKQLKDAQYRLDLITRKGVQDLRFSMCEEGPIVFCAENNGRYVIRSTRILALLHIAAELVEEEERAILQQEYDAL